MNKITISLILGVLCLLTYTTSLHNPFLMDDHALILDNPHIGDLSHLQLNPFAHRADDSGGDHYIYFRPITHLADFVSYSLFGRNIFGYHVMNLGLLYLAALLWWHLLARLFPDSPVALIGSALLVTHPVFGVLVNYTSTTGYILLILFTIGGFLCHLNYVAERRPGWAAAAILCFGLSLLCHETAAGFPFYLAGLLYFSRRLGLRRALLHTLPYLGVIALYILFRFHYASLKSGVIDNIGGFQLGFVEYVAFFAQLVFHYLKNLIFFGDIVLIYSAPSSPAPVVWVAALAVVLAAAVYLLLVRWRDNPKGLFMWWLMVGFGPVTLACFSRPSMGLIISPHWLLIPSLGYCLFIALLFSEVYASGRHILSLCLTGFLVVAGVSVSQHYNRLWSNEILYCHYMLKLSPRIPLAKFWLAHAYASRGHWEQARRYFQETIMGVENDWKGYVNLGVVEGQLGNKEMELCYYKKAVQLKPDSPDIWNNLAAAYIDRKEYDKARTILTRILRRDPGFVAARENLSRIPAGR